MQHYRQRKNRKDLTLKQFRSDFPENSATARSLIQIAWQQVRAFVGEHILPCTVDTALIERALELFSEEQLVLDGYDQFIVLVLGDAGITQFMTDDRDFGQVSGLTVFTANTSLIREAHEAGLQGYRIKIDSGFRMVHKPL
jgi:hypothetical protein